LLEEMVRAHDDSEAARKESQIIERSSGSRYPGRLWQLSQETQTAPTAAQRTAAP
jgi:hypothetical protein